MPNVNSNVLASLDALARRHEQVTAEMNDPAVASDATRIVAAAKELARLTRTVGPYRRYQGLLKRLDEDRALLNDPATDAEMKELVAAGVMKADDPFPELTLDLPGMDETERRIGEFARRKTLMFNGYADQVASLYAGMDLKKNY